MCSRGTLSTEVRELNSALKALGTLKLSKALQTLVEGDFKNKVHI